MRTVVVALTLTVLSATGRADSEKAKQLNAEAEALVASGDLIGAAAKFRAAYKEEPRPEHMCNSGVAYHKAKDLPRSHRYLNQCVAMGGSLDPAYRENLRKVVESIEQKLVAGNFTPIDIALEPATAVLVIEGGKPYDEEIVGGGRIWVPYGTYRFVVRAPGFLENRSEVAASAHAAMPLRVTLDKQPEVVPDKPIDKPIITVVEPKPIAASRPSKVPAIIATAATGALGISAIVFYVRARGLVDDAESPSNSIEKYNDLHDQAHTNQKVAWVVGGLAGAGAIVSGFLWWKVLRAPATVEITSTGSGVAVRGRF